MKRLLLVTQGFPFGESERSFLTAEFEELIRTFEVSILAYGLEDKLLYSFPEKVQVFRYGTAAIQPLRLAMQILKPEVREDIQEASRNCRMKNKILRTGKILTYSLRAEQVEKQIKQIIKNEKIDLIYTYWCVQATVAALRLKKEFSQLKVITRFHGFDLYKERMQVGWQPLREFVNQKCDMLAFVCEAGKDYFIEHWGQDTKEKCVTAYLGSRSMPQVTPADTGELVLVSCSNLISLKRVELIIGALALLPEEMKVNWNHLGDGPERERLENLAKEKLGQKSNVRWKFWGEVPNTEIEQIYLKLQPNLFITTSSTEGLPVSVEEAFAMGIPAVGTDVGGMSELIIDGKTGFLLLDKPGINEIAEKLKMFRDLSEQQQKEMGAEARKLWSKRYNACENAQRFVIGISTEL